MAELYLQMGIGYYELGKNNVAMERLQHALKLDDKNSGIHDAIAVLYQKLEEYDKAKYHFKEAMDEIRAAWRAEVRMTHPDRMIARGVPEEAVKLAEKRLNAEAAA